LDLGIPANDQPLWRKQRIVEKSNKHVSLGNCAGGVADRQGGVHG